MQSTASIRVRFFPDGKKSDTDEIPDEGPGGCSNQFPLWDGRQMELIDLNEITYCKASGNYTEIHLCDGRRKLLSKSLKWTELMLRSYPEFRRLHHAFLVNVHFITALEKAAMWHLEIHGVRLPVSRKGKIRLMSMMKH